MSEKTPHRRPATFKLDDPGVIVMDPEDSSRPARGTIHVTPEADPSLLPVPIDTPLVPVRRGFRWGTLFWAAVGGLVLLGLGLGVVNLIEDLFARSESLGFLGLAFAIVAALALIVVVAREAFGLARRCGRQRATWPSGHADCGGFRPPTGEWRGKPGRRPVGCRPPPRASDARHPTGLPQPRAGNASRCGLRANGK